MAPVQTETQQHMTENNQAVVPKGTACTGEHGTTLQAVAAAPQAAQSVHVSAVVPRGGQTPARPCWHVVYTSKAFRMGVGLTFLVLLVLPVGIVADDYRRRYARPYCTGNTPVYDNYCRDVKPRYCPSSPGTESWCRWVDHNIVRRVVLACLCTQQLLLFIISVVCPTVCVPRTGLARLMTRHMQCAVMLANLVTNAFAFVYVRGGTVMLWHLLCLFPVPVLLGAALCVGLPCALLFGVGWSVWHIAGAVGDIMLPRRPGT